MFWYYRPVFIDEYHFLSCFINEFLWRISIVCMKLIYNDGICIIFHNELGFLLVSQTFRYVCSCVTLICHLISIMPMYHSVNIFVSNDQSLDLLCKLFVCWPIVLSVLQMYPSSPEEYNDTNNRYHASPNPMFPKDSYYMPGKGHAHYLLPPTLPLVIPPSPSHMKGAAL